MLANRSLLLSGVAFAGLCAVASPAFAQEPATQDIVVTARRVEERLQDVPISMSVFTQAQITERNVVSASDLATYTPSLTSNARFGSDNATFAIRGFVQQTQTSPSVAVYFADVAALRVQSPFGAGGNGAGPGSFFDLQNVQVLKGPQGTLFGRNTTGGAILLVPQKPTSKFEGYVEGSIGNYNMHRVQGVINIPLAETLRFRAGVEYQKRDGFVRNKSGIGPRDFSDINYVAARASLTWDVTPDIENYTVATYSRSDTNGLVPRVIGTATGPNCSPAITGAGALLGPLVCSQQVARATQRGNGYYDVENSAPNPYSKVKQWQAINTTTWTASDALTLKNIASYGEYTMDLSANNFGDNVVLPAAFGPLAGAPFGYVTNYQNGDLHFAGERTFSEELQLKVQAGRRLNFQVGAYYEKATPLGGFQSSIAPILLSCTNAQAFQCIDVLRNPVTGRPGGFIQITRTQYRFENIGFYGQGTYELTDHLSITGGLRYTIDRVQATAATQTVTFPSPNTPVATCAAFPGRLATSVDACVNTGRQESKKPTWLIDLDYKPSDDIMVYAKYARGYRQGGVDAGNSVVLQWGPEKLESYEIGAKTSFHGPVPGYLNIAGFYNDFSNQQLAANLVPDGSNPAAAPAQAIVNAGASRIQGVEVDAGLNPFKGLRLTGGYTYLDTKLKSYAAPPIPGYLPPAPSSRVGGELVASPKHKVSLSGTYTLPLDESIGQVSFGATFTYTAKQLGSAATLPEFQYIPATSLLNLNFGWTNVGGRPVDFSVFATNVTKVKYPNFTGGAYFSQGSEIAILGEPRMIGARLKVRFGQ